MTIDFPDSFWADTWAAKHGARGRLSGAVLAAGFGRRLEPLTARHLPKPLFPLAGKAPIAELWVRRFLESGVSDVTMNISVLADMIRRHFGDGAKFGVDLKLVEEEIPTGTLGGVCVQALASGAAHEAGSTVIAPSGDIVSNFGVDLLEEMYDVHKRKGAAITIVVNPIPDDRKGDFGTVVLDSPEALDGPLGLAGPISAFREKDPESPSNLNNASIYMIERELLEILDGLRTPASLDEAEPFYDFGKHVFPAMLGLLPYVTLPGDFPLWAVRYDGGWFDIGNKRDYLTVHRHLLDGRIDVPVAYEPLPWGYLGANVAIDFAGVTIRPPVIIGNDCVIENGATIGPYAVIGDGWTVARGAVIENSVLWERYPYFADGGVEVPVAERLATDRHEIRAGVTVSGCIVAGGALDADAADETLHVDEDGELVRLSIDYVPEGRRA